MYTHDSSSEDTYDTAQERNRKRRQARNKKKRTRQRQLKIVLSVAVFTLTLTAAAGWQILKQQTDVWQDLSKEATTLLPLEQQQKNQRKKDRAASKPKKASLTPEEITLPEQRTDTTADDEKEVAHITSVSDEWNLILVNPWNTLPKNYEVSLMPLENGQSIDSRCYVELQEMLAACRADGLQPLICSSYRTQEMQEALFQERIDELKAQGYSEKDADTKAATSVARPGTSEHQLGLALDIVDKTQQMLDYTQEYTMVQQWLIANSWKYGFILRYPNDKSELTGIIYEPWHYRFVGKEVAEEIHTRNICFEEYLEGLKKER